MGSPQAEILKEEGHFLPKAGLDTFKHSKLENVWKG